MNNIEKRNVLNAIRCSNYKCLIKPENPFSLDNPDAFVYRYNILYAIFIPTFMERENPDHLLRRLYVSQLSCGTRFVPILLWDEEKKLSDSAFQSMKNSFAHITNDIQDVMDYVGNGEKGFRKWKYFSRLQQCHYMNYRLCLDFSMFEHDRIMQEGDMDVRNSNEINFDVVRNMESWSEQGKAWYTKKIFSNTIWRPCPMLQERQQRF